MAANTNQPNRGNQGNPADAGRSNPQSGGSQGQTARSGDQQGRQAAGVRDEGLRSFGSAGTSSQGQNRQGNDEATRYLDAIEENVNKLRSAMSGSGRSETSEGRSERQASQGRERDEDTGSARDL